MKKPTKKRLVAAAKNLNAVCQPDPEIGSTEEGVEGDPTALTQDELIESIGEVAGDCLSEDDDLEEDTWAVLGELDLIELEEEEEEEEEEEQAPAKPKSKSKAKASSSRQGGKPGVCASIIEFIQNDGPITKADIVAKLKKRFPDRNEDSMAKTVNVQVPNRINKEKNLNVVLTDNGYQIGGKPKTSKKKAAAAAKSKAKTKASKAKAKPSKAKASKAKAKPSKAKAKPSKKKAAAKKS